MYLIAHKNFPTQTQLKTQWCCWDSLRFLSGNYSPDLSEAGKCVFLRCLLVACYNALELGLIIEIQIGTPRA